MKPASWSQEKVSCPDPGYAKKKIQVKRVLVVPIVARYGADAYFVTATPKPLEKAIQKIVVTEKNRIQRLSPIYWKASLVSSNL